MTDGDWVAYVRGTFGLNVIVVRVAPRARVLVSAPQNSCSGRAIFPTIRPSGICGEKCKYSTERDPAAQERIRSAQKEWVMRGLFGKRQAHLSGNVFQRVG